MRRSVVAVGVIAAVVVAAAAYAALNGDDRSDPVYRIAKVERGSVVKSVTASGKLNAVTTVMVGSQISGRVSELLADFNSEVAANQVIARIDPHAGQPLGQARQVSAVRGGLGAGDRDP